MTCFIRIPKLNNVKSDATERPRRGLLHVHTHSTRKTSRVTAPSRIGGKERKSFFFLFPQVGREALTHLTHSNTRKRRGKTARHARCSFVGVGKRHLITFPFGSPPHDGTAGSFSISFPERESNISIKSEGKWQERGKHTLVYIPVAYIFNTCESEPESTRTQIIMSARSPTKLSRYLVTPSRVASLMDWKATLGTGAVMALDINRDRIGVAVASNPNSSSGVATARTLDPILLPRKRSASTSAAAAQASHPHHDHPLSHLEEVAAREQVCGVIVRWPLQDGGRMGAQCGRILYQLDNFVAADSGKKRTLIGKNRPFALYDDRPLTQGQAIEIEDSMDMPDEWGRHSSFSRVPEMAALGAERGRATVQISPHKPNDNDQDDEEMAAKILQDFLNGHFAQNDDEDDFLGLNGRPAAARSSTASPPRKTLATAAPKQSLIAGAPKRRPAPSSSSSKHNLGSSIDNESERAYISPSLL